MRSGGGWRRRTGLGLLVVLTAVVLLHGLVVETFTVPSASMSPTLKTGDRILVRKVDVQVRRGAVIVFDGSHAFADAPRDEGLLRRTGQALGIRPGGDDYVKRVIGVGGDRVTADEQGRVKVNGQLVSEPYLGSTGQTAFDVRVPSGQVFVMGDNRRDSEDSSTHLGDPGGGTVPVEDVIGIVVGRYWPLDAAGSVT